MGVTVMGHEEEERRDVVMERDESQETCSFTFLHCYHYLSFLLEFLSAYTSHFLKPFSQFWFKDWTILCKILVGHQ